MPRQRAVVALIGALIASAATSAGAQTGAGTLIFTRTVDRTDLYTARDDGTNQRRLGDVGRIPTGPGWAPDGSRIVFSRSRGEPTGPDVWTMAPDGSDARFLAGTPHADLDPSFSPDGRRVAFVAYATTRFLLQVVNADGSGLRALADGPFPLTYDWSPDSRRIVSANDRGAMSIVDVESGRLEQLPNVSGDWPTWSPDGKLIAFGRFDRQVAGGRLHVMAPDGSGLRQLSTRPIAEPAAWAPDSRSLAFIGRRVVTYARYGPVFATEILSVAADGSNERKLTRAGSETMPSWSGDGSRIAFTTARDPDRLARRAAYVMNADGSCESRVAAGVVWRNPWRPGPASTQPPLACADLGMTLRATRRAISRRQRVRFIVRVRNDGSRPATRVVVRLAAGRPTHVVLGRLAVGAARTVEFVVRPRRTGALVARASVRAREPDRNRSDNTAVVTIRRR
jgi:dipeptidyl aminopeptidase/acylaminoacyl peptidase